MIILGDKMGKNNLFCVDIDNTLICQTVPDKYGICVAVKNGKNASYMRNDTYDKFVRLTSLITVLPVTTRCRESYENIYLKKFFERALVDNGAILVSKSSQEMKDWIFDSRKLIEGAKVSFDEARKLIEAYGYTEKWGSEFVLDYTCKGITQDDKKELMKELDKFSGDLLVRMGETSMLCTYKNLSKGENIKRYARKFNYNLFISAGDSLEDVSMFEQTDISIGKSGSTYIFKTDNKLDFCDSVVNTVYDLLSD